MADILPHLRLDEAATRQRHAVWPNRSGHVAHHGAGTLTSANHGSSGHGTGFGAKRFISRGSVQGDSCHSALSETIPQLGTIWPEVKWSCFRSWQPARVLARAQPERQIWVTTHLFGSSPPPRTIGSIKGQVTGLWSSLFLLSIPRLLIPPSSPTRLLTPPSSPPHRSCPLHPPT